MNYHNLVDNQQSPHESEQRKYDGIHVPRMVIRIVVKPVLHNPSLAKKREAP